MQPSFDALYRALVTSNTDATNTGKIRVQCPQIAGSAEIRTAEPANLQMPIPNVGTTVWIGFSGGDVTKPFYFANSSFTTTFLTNNPAGTVQLSSVATSTNPDTGLLQVVSGASGVATGNTAAPHVSLKDGNGTSAIDLFLSGTVIKRDLTGARYTWQTPAFGSGWAAGPSSGTVQTLRYRFDAFDNLVIIGACHTTSATPSTTLMTLPSLYRPATNQRPGIHVNNAGTISANVANIASSTGIVSLITALAATNVDVYFDLLIPMGNIS